ncbi:hypothetical protein LRS10_05910 [Phenylobacterium sp. J426]|uniref:DUF2306 domain-containing protein n=1 Tax=Phenylobacterium sp. J426 TaxID=2898439 RepID=UPI00215191BB|nr:hypothetical protein [Phenylobacterium sp. J426]MCR5873751.1 hypothetical protein [Phenylobacterium sp. J426]
MSQPLGKPVRKPMGFAPWFALSMGVVALILALALGPFWLAVFQMVGRARPHAPDLELFADLSTPIKIHLITALAALVLGGVLMAARKGRAFHRLAGWTWVSLVSVTAGVTLLITELNDGAWSLLHLFTGWTLLILPLAVLAAKRHNVARHRRSMMGLFYGAFAINFFIAFIPGRTMWQMFFG